ncbi:hypothetical protein BV898_07368 [Hypsibius exemplaris]|uniref:Uncharacterized protein n=1 Tax=Hypsibius exemplaris TaxID=2072580 RepID=A0A1W0WTR9_HYPEX|nr:hypothetical protein BV898_07368 [Hypsibius exemplaris]
MTPTPESPLPGLRTKTGFLAAVASEVRAAFLKTQKTVPPKPFVNTYRPPVLLSTLEPKVKKHVHINDAHKRSFAKIRQRNSYELITRHLLQALQKESTNIQELTTSSEPVGKATQQAPGTGKTAQQAPEAIVRQSSPGRRHRRPTERRRTHHGRATKDQHYFYKKHHLPTPPFVRKLAAKFRVDANFDEHVSQSPESTRRLNLANPVTDKNRAFVRNPGHSSNLYAVHESPSLVATENFVRTSRQLQRVTLPVLGPNRVQTEMIHLRDKRFRVPVLNFDQRAMAQRFKAVRNNPEYLAGIRVECGQDWQLSDKSALIGKKLPYPNSQLLATARRDRKMQVNKKLSILQRTRDLNRKETRLALKKRKVRRMQLTLQELDEDMCKAAKQSDRKAIEHEGLLRRSDQHTIVAIHAANDTKVEREQAERLLADVQAHNNMLLCHNVRREEKIKLVDRFINVIYDSVPEDIKKVLLDRRKKERRERLQKHPIPPMAGSATTDIKLMSEVVKCHKSLSEESRVDFPSDDEDIDANGDKLLPLLYEDPSEIIPHLGELYRASTEAYHTMGQIRYESRSIRTRVGIEGEVAAERNKKIQLDCDRVEEEIRILSNEIEVIRSDNDRYETKEFRRDHMRRPINILRNHIFRYYRRNFETPEESIKKMLIRMHTSVTDIVAKFQDIPLEYTRQCYQAAEKDPTLENFIAAEMVKRDVHDRRMQKFYYRSLDPPEIIWGRACTPHWEVAEFMANQLHQYENEVTSMEFGEMATNDPDTWLASRIRQMTEIEFEGIPSPIRGLEEEEEIPSSHAIPHPGNALDETESRHATITCTAVAPLDEAPTKTPAPEPITEIAQPKSYPDLTELDIQHDLKTKHFFSNYEVMMKGDDVAASAPTTTTADVPVVLPTNGTEENSSGSAAVPQGGLPQMESFDKSSTSRDSGASGYQERGSKNIRDSQMDPARTLRSTIRPESQHELSARPRAPHMDDYSDMFVVDFLERNSDKADEADNSTHPLDNGSESELLIIEGEVIGDCSVSRLVPAKSSTRNEWIDETESRHTTITWAAVAPLDEAPTQGPSPEPVTEIAQPKSYPDLTELDIQHDLKIKHFFSNYEVMMKGDDVAASTSTTTADVPVMLLTNGTEENNSGSAAVPQGGLPQVEPLDATSTNIRDSQMDPPRTSRPPAPHMDDYSDMFMVDFLERNSDKADETPDSYSHPLDNGSESEFLIIDGEVIGDCSVSRLVPAKSSTRLITSHDPMIVTGPNCRAQVNVVQTK